jgi:hypothetical protein
MDDRVQRRMRSDYHGEVTIECGENGGTHGPCNIRNISLNGVYIEIDSPLKECKNCKLIIKLGDDGSIELEIDGEVVRYDQAGMAVKFSSMSPTTFDHLRKVVMYNSSDPEDFLKECRDKPGFK